MPINLSIFTNNIDTVINTFNSIRVERSRGSSSGPFVETTSASAQPASLTGGAGPFPVLGLTLSISINGGDQVDVVFAGSASLTADQVVAQINLALGATIAFNSSNVLVLTSNITGTASKVEIIGGAAASVLGFTAGQVDTGEDPYIPLVPEVSNYSYTDETGEAGDWYRTRFFNTITGVVSAYSTAFRGSSGQQVNPASLSLCTVDLVDQAGNARAGQRISFYPVSSPIQIDGYWAGVSQRPINIVTDSNGHAEINLIAGQTLRVAFAGSTLVREFVVPNTAFDLLGVLASTKDIFDAQRPQIPAAPRRTI